MRLATPEQISKIENLIETDYSISPEILMENAGALAAREIRDSFLPEIQRGRIAILCGPGNNGGDGLVTARHLVNLGFSAVEVFLFDESKSKIRDLQLKRLQNLKVKIKTLEEGLDCAIHLKGFELFVDALFGVGLSKPVQGVYFEAISLINSSSKPVVSLDIPSGLHGLTGKVLNICARAHLTLTFGLAKPGIYLQAGAEYAGRVRVLPIGFPNKLVKEHAGSHFAINERWARRRLPVRKLSSNKFDHGRLYVVAGSPGKWGAAALCCNGAYRIGAGYVTLITEKSASQKYLGNEIGAETLVSDFSNSEIFERADAFVIGPGSGTSDDVKRFIQSLMERNFEKVVLDADALTVLSQIGDIKLPSSWILTPHTGELSRVMGLKSQEVENDRLGAVSAAAMRFGCYVLLKGFRSLVAGPRGEVGIVVSGNSALAKAGTGDVLAGFIGALLAQGLTSFDGATTGAYIHGRIADTWVKSGKDMRSLVASDLVTLVPDELHRVQTS